MELLVRVVAARSVHADLAVEVDPMHSVAELTDALCRRVEVSGDSITITVARTHETLDPSAAVAGCDLVSGDVLLLGLPSSRRARREPPTRAIALDVLSGPDSGRSLMMVPGRHQIGRDPSSDLVIDDASVSRHHAVITVDAAWTIAVGVVAGAVNGVTVNDRRLQPGSTSAINLGDVIALGGSRLTVRAVERSTRQRRDRLGQIEFHRTPYRPPAPGVGEPVVVGPIPERPARHQLRVMAMMAPMIGGAAIFAFSRQPQFLALTAASPLMMLATFVEDRRSGRVAFRRQLKRFEAALPEHRSRLERLRQRERIDRWRAAPDLADLARRADLRTVDLWARGRDSPDFLSLRVGVGCCRVRHRIELAGGGDDDLRNRLIAELAGLETVDDVPIVVDLGAHPVMGICGDRGLVDGVVRSLLAQAAILHSPEDLTIVSAVSPDRGLEWLRWLPHVRSIGAPVLGTLVTRDRSHVAQLLDRLLDVTDRRIAERRSDAGPSRWPRLLLVLDADLEPDAAVVSRLLDGAHRSGVAVIWMAASVAGVPRQAEHVLETSVGEAEQMTGQLWSTRVEVDQQTLEVDHLRARRADAVARALAPLRDASTASLRSAIPRVAPVFDVLAIPSPSAPAIVESWADRGHRDLSFAIGMGAGGPIVIDLVDHGPHALIGGTSGAGKSELLQAMVVGLAVRHPPTRVNFLFVDYKGGAATNVFRRLPHSVGYVTNLGPDLARRALTSLRAEVDRRQRVMEGRARDLAQLLEVAPDDAPPALVIIVDEFATLTEQVPEFVAGMIDIAQRGRSLGIHLVLATQRPSTVNENITANANLRISLRTLSRAESLAILDSPVAADIPVPLRGRAVARIGPRQLVEFQSSYVNASSGPHADSRSVRVANLDGADDASPRVTTGAATDGDRSQRALLLDAIVDADRVLGLPPAMRPWHDVLPDVVTLDGLIGDTGATTDVPGRFVTIGLLDEPERQVQRPAVVDLEQGGGWLVIGSGASGKTTLLRTVAASISATASPGDVEIVAFDFQSRQLAGIAPLPEVVDVVTGDDLEAVTRHISMLELEPVRRRQLLADAQAENLSAYNVRRRALPRIVVLVDGMGALTAAFGGAGGRLVGSAGGVALDQWNERVQRIVVDGRQVGIHTVMTADRQQAVPQPILSAISNRTVLRLADANAYVDHGVAAAIARTVDLPPGRGLMNGRVLVQVASVSADPSGKAQADRIAELAAGRSPTPSVLRSSPLPTSISVAELGRPLRRGELAIGVADITGATVGVDLRASSFTICGSRQSGRSTTLATVATALHADHDVFMASASTPEASWSVAGVPPDRRAVGCDAVAAMLHRLFDVASTATARSCRHPQPVLLIDDAERLDTLALAPQWDQILSHGAVRIVAAVSSRAMAGYSSTSPLLGWLRRWEQLLVLRPDDAAEFFSITNVRLDLRPGSELPPGRGVVLRGRVSTLVQVAHS